MVEQIYMGMTIKMVQYTDVNLKKKSALLIFWLAFTIINNVPNKWLSVNLYNQIDLKHCIPLEDTSLF